MGLLGDFNALTCRVASAQAAAADGEPARRFHRPLCPFVSAQLRIYIYKVSPRRRLFSSNPFLIPMPYTVTTKDVSRASALS